MKTLTRLQLKNLERHQHLYSGVSLLEPFVQLFWNWVAKFLPRWIAPNTIAFSGLSVHLTTSVALFYFCPNAIETAPYWLYAANAASLVVFQAFEAFSREHAQFTDTWSPLNELFNHGCRSISVITFVVGVCISMKLGNSTWIMTFLCLATYATFYCGYWCAFVTGVSHVGKFHVVEVQVFAVLIFIVSGIFGPTVWYQSIPILQYSWMVIPVGVGFFLSANTIIRFVKIILEGGCGDNGATIADTSVISPSFSILFIEGAAIVIASKSKSALCENHPVLYLLFVGISCAKVTNCLVVSHLTKNELQHLDSTMLGLFVLFLNQYFGTVVNEDILLWLCMFYTLIDLNCYLYKIYRQAADHFKIRIFSLIPLEQHLKKD